jgi:diguanylate cyclase (GGDEF)-like protein/PAS domain S-box-containing protein
VTWSPDTYRIFGVEPEHHVPSRDNVLAMVVEEDRERLRGEVDRAIREDGGFDCFVTIRRTDGELRDLRVRGAVHQVGAGPRHLIGIVQDLTDVRAHERERIELGERFRSVFERAPVGIALVAPGGEVTLANEALAEFLGRETLVGLRVEELTHPDDIDQHVAAIRQLAAGELAEWNAEARYVRPDGEVRWGAVRALLVREMAAGRDLEDALPAIARILVEELGWEQATVAPDGKLALAGDGEPVGEELATEIGAFAARRRAEEQRLHDALHDPLTGLPNRVLFFDRLDHAMRRQQREQSPLAVLFLDFDGFKAVNDRFGHSGGDTVLRRAAAMVASTLRAEDTVARFGGDELVVLSEHILGRKDAAAIAQRILDRLRDPIALEGGQIVLSASIGICVAPVEGPTPEQLLDLADAALYRAKAAGPGRYVIAD